MMFSDIPIADFYDILLFKYYGVGEICSGDDYLVTVYKWGDNYCVTDCGRIK